MAKPEQTANKTLYVQSFCVTQNEVVQAFEKATGAEWEKRRFDSGKWRDEHKKKADQGDREAVEDVVWYLGTVDANWENRETFAMDLLGLKNENLEDVVIKIVKEAR